MKEESQQLGIYHHRSFSSYNDKLLEDPFLHSEKSFKAATAHLHDLEEVPHNKKELREKGRLPECIELLKRSRGGTTL